MRCQASPPLHRTVILQLYSLVQKNKPTGLREPESAETLFLTALYDHRSLQATILSQEHRKPKKIEGSEGSRFEAAIKGMQVKLRTHETVPLPNGTVVGEHLSSKA